MIELLVVVAIIAVLIALLLPSLKKAQSMAREVVCQSNLRQIALWGVQYATEYSGYLPSEADWNTQRNTRYTYYELAGMPNSPTRSSFWYEKSFYKRSQKSGGVLFCPQLACDIGSKLHSESEYGGSTYAINYYLGGTRDPGNVLGITGAGTPSPNTLKIQRLTSSIAWFADGCISKAWDGDSWSATNSMPPTAGRHCFELYGWNLGNPQAIPWSWLYTERFRGSWQNVTHAIFDSHPNDITNFVAGDGHTTAMPYTEFVALRKSSSDFKAFVLK